MSATLDIAVSIDDLGFEVPYSVRLALHPPGGRSIERLLASGAVERIEVEPGETILDATFSSGHVESLALVLAEGETRRVEFVAPGSPHESMRWLNLSRGALAVRRSRPPVWEVATPDPPPPPPPPVIEKVSAAVLTREGSKQVQIVGDLNHAEARVLHLRDARDLSVFRDHEGSALALLELSASGRPDRVRLAALPGPSSTVEQQREVHAALRPLPGNALPEVQIVPTKPELATIVGALERRDQRTLALARSRFVDRAVRAMEDKRRDPTGAAIGLVLLLRLAELDTIEGWSANLWRWFPALPDGAALHTAVLLRAPAESRAWNDELRSAALGATRSGLPLLSDSLRYLRRALVFLDADGPDAEVQAALRWCDRLVRSMDPDAVFTTVTLDARDVKGLWGQAR